MSPPTAPDRAARGRHAEQVALDYLRAHGLVLVSRNFRCRLGEIDLIMREGQCLVFVEVRYRKSSRYASASESVDWWKRRKLVGAAGYFLGRHAAFRESTTRFDVVALDGPSQNEIRLEWLKDAFRPGDD